MQTPISLSTLESVGVKLQALVADLEENFAWRTPNFNDDYAKIMYHAGQASVIDYIKQKLEED